MTPGMHVRVVNSYAADREEVSVMEDNRVDLPTEGKPIIQTLAFPNLDTSKPSDLYRLAQVTVCDT
jgi:hypothetical protein